MHLSPADLPNVIEALLFVAPEPLGEEELQRTLLRLHDRDGRADAPARQALLDAVPAAIAEVRGRWHHAERGFGLIEVAAGLAFRTNPRFAPAVAALRELRPPRLSRAAMETLAIVAYRQPITRPEADQIRGVDCGGALRALLDRHLIRVVGKREEAGRPLLYGTTREFLNMFSLPDLTQLPSLAEFRALQQKLATAVTPAVDGLPDLAALAASAPALAADDEASVAALDAAVAALGSADEGVRGTVPPSAPDAADDPAAAGAAAPAP